MLVSSNLPGTMQLFGTPRTGGQLTQITSYDEPVGGGYFPTVDDLLVLKDDGGNERTQIYRMRDDGSRRPQPSPTTRSSSTASAASPATDGRSRTSPTAATAIDFDVYVHDLATGQERLVFDMGGWCSASGFSPDGRSSRSDG